MFLNRVFFLVDNREKRYVQGIINQNTSKHTQEMIKKLDCMEKSPEFCSSFTSLICAKTEKESQKKKVD